MQPEEKQVPQKRKIKLRWILLIVVIIFVNSRIFTTNRWIAHPNRRGKMLFHLSLMHDFDGMTEAEVIEILGEESNTSFFQTGNNLVYCLGPEPGLISIDDAWMIIEFTDGVVSSINVTTD